MQFVIVTSFWSSEHARSQCWMNGDDGSASNSNSNSSSIQTTFTMFVEPNKIMLYNEKLSMQRIRCGEMVYE